jgi:protein phosphatase slingshot
MAVYSNNNANPADIQQHLQSIFNLLRPEDTLKMAVRLESQYPSRVRYLVVITSLSCRVNNREESCLLGIDCKQKEATIGLVVAILADTKITLDGDGGFSMSVGSRNHIFKPISVQAMWSSLQTLLKAADDALKFNYYAEERTHGWCSYYNDNISSDRSCLNEWNIMDGLTSRRPPSPDLCTEPEETKKTKDLIRTKLKEIMTSVDLDEVTSKAIRTKLEEELNRKLREYKSFIDEEMLVILGQMDTATEVFPYLYLGSEWNASNLDELRSKGVGKIVNVTREIDNFYPGAFDYYNVRVYDDDSTEMLKHWDKTYRYIVKAT